MTRAFWMGEDAAVAEKYGGHFDAGYKRGLPGAICPDCGVTWAGSGHNYPCVDLSSLPERAEFEVPRPEPFAEFARLRELVRPLAPRGAALPPGTEFGPLVGRASGAFASFAWQGSSLLLVQHDALGRLRAEGVRGLSACRTELRFRQKNPPDLLDLQIEPRGRLHSDCIPADFPPPCPTCGRWGLQRPDEPILDVASLPTDVDLFRVGNFATMIICTERFRDAVLRLKLEGITFRELPTR